MKHSATTPDSVDPFSLVELFTRAFPLWQKTVRSLAVVTIVLYLPLHIIGFFAPVPEADVQYAPILSSMVSVLMILAFLFILAASARIVWDTLEGKTISAGQALRETLKKSAAISIPALVPVAIAFIPFLLQGDTELLNSGIEIINKIGIVLIFPMIWYAMFSAFYIFQIMLKDYSINNAIAGSIQLFKKRLFKFALTAVLFYIAYSFVYLTLTVLLPWSVPNTILMTVPAQLVVDVATTFFVVAQVLLYKRLSEVK
jgi:hypothetical protein